MLKHTPLVEVIEAARVTALPDFHPEAGPTFAGFPVNAFVIHHPDGPILVDTGIGTGNEHIDNWYRPLTSDLRAELTSRNIDPDSALTIVNTHLHFDHCGQNQSFPSASIYAQQAEIDVLASDPFYTVAAWAKMPLNRSDGHRRRLRNCRRNIGASYARSHTRTSISGYTIQQRNHHHRRTMLVDRQ